MNDDGFIRSRSASNGVKYLITGGAGFIGSNFIRHVLKNEPDAKIINFDDLSSGSLDNLRDMELDRRYGFRRGNIVSDSELAAVVGRRPDVIVHFAAEMSGGEADIKKFLKTNISGTVNILESARVYNIPKVVLISTTGVYGPSNEILPNEEGLLNPEGIYSISKTAGEVAARCFQSDVSLNIVRLGPVFGPYQDGRRTAARLIIDLLSEGRAEIKNSEKAVRQWINVYDVCEGISEMIKKWQDGETYNLSGDKEMTLKELADFIADYLGTGGKSVEFSGHRNAEKKSAEGEQDRPERYAADSSKIMSLGWRPRRKLEESLRDTIEWYSHNKWWWEKQMKEDYFKYYRKQYLG